MDLITRDYIPNFSSLFNSFFDREVFLNNVEIGKQIPATNIYEKEDAFLIDIAAPGFEKKDFKIDLKDNTLTISSEKKEEQTEEKKKVTKQEFSYTSFKRSFTMPDSVDLLKVNANYDKGVLKIHLPKKDELKKIAAREIKIS